MSGTALRCVSDSSSSLARCNTATVETGRKAGLLPFPSLASPPLASRPVPSLPLIGVLDA